MTMNCSVVILTSNEEKNIERCLKSISFCKDILVIDDFSKDKTVDIVEKYGAKVYKRHLNNDFSSQKNYGIEKAKNKWILFLDADEQLNNELIKEILDLNVENNINGYFLKRHDFFWDKELKHGEVKKARNKGIIRLVKKGTGKWKGSVHEELVVQGNVLSLNGYINHYPHQTIKEFLKSVNFYSTLRARELYNQKKKTNIFEIIFFPFFKFILTYIMYFGFLDGASGFVYSFFMSFHSFLVRVKLYQYCNIDNK